jgi:adenine-specific DNA-methyltransferase
MTDNQTKFQQLLRELFQFDSADLDFGIYRIMNHKREVIERFIAIDLPHAITEELEQGALAGQAEAAAELQATKKRVLDALGDDAFDADGNLEKKYRDAKAGKEYLSALEKAKTAKGRDALETAAYNNLYTFFSRYYQDGDFISKRRYSKKEHYAVPYNGEEVMLYWVNHDQYYVKTGEYFTDYTWKAPNGVAVHFKLKAADVEQNNVKGETRFFLPRPGEMSWDEKAQELTIPFEYRPLTEQENITYGQKNQQEAVISKSVVEIPGQRSIKNSATALAALTAEKRLDNDGENISLLEHHLRQYTRRNTSDFFIHKDLAGFLNRELDFYLKNEVLNLEEVETAGEGLGVGWFQLMRLIKKIGGCIIEFLAQIENFQKMLWEKRKFITEIFYCITIGNIPEPFLPEIATCDEQWEEWKQLFHIDEEQAGLFSTGKGTKDKRIAFLKAHPTLVLDTRHYSVDFVDLLLASFADLDEMIGGLLVDSENWQALNLLKERFQEKVRCIYIDPPYNTGNDEFIYKDIYQHSSWLTMMRDRILFSAALLSQDGSHYCQIDTNENYRLALLLDTILVFQREVIWDTQVLSGFKTIAENWIRGHETILFHSKTENNYFIKQRQPHRKEYLDRFDKQDEHGRWYFDGRGTILYKDEVIEKGKAVGDVWFDIMSFQQQPTSKERVDFFTQKPEELLERIIRSSTDKSNWVLDYFLGSGTTCAAALKLGRKSIGIEMGRQLVEIALPRLKGVLYGLPTTLSQKEQYSGGGVIKYIRLESYEDALNNIGFNEAPEQPAMQFDDFLIRYILKWETRQSDTLLNVVTFPP